MRCFTYYNRHFQASIAHHLTTSATSPAVLTRVSAYHLVNMPVLDSSPSTSRHSTPNPSPLPARRRLIVEPVTAAASNPAQDCQNSNQTLSSQTTSCENSLKCPTTNGEIKHRYKNGAPYFSKSTPHESSSQPPVSPSCLKMNFNKSEFQPTQKLDDNHPLFQRQSSKAKVASTNYQWNYGVPCAATDGNRNSYLIDSKTPGFDPMAEDNFHLPPSRGSSMSPPTSSGEKHDTRPSFSGTSSSGHHE